ncbi:putative CoA-substrate-specific enzyme activase [Clostridium saccharoperbutylacetonicum]|uniref:CoA-substrate-specific enzyme activase n=1 Tax=Clostridium saccharoperbutylacetonicum N1-4(HMT) TaxID=931276 RepID=M1N2B1_9CLOT|nr:acyl-CoA dehydratase activase [Clostridium saccharoperbutylacetonicum]AGF57617.1 CoA-substrate-specific enzyme activase [Clostridium saccharoperbutylacetonicum N1-4(HMT)]NRT61615.1 putative CoA-substrate-specific enzyme activase [Clostridium saccharoperbutylacetonicum]NSB24938.1 putative CoA-substrate-specific enzyme activase [Clostridium saccharoperbutylacetonicum]NSB44309.1 putative CoA-substrate-specific enzyme activase [Clostridium saccharoperbutylacetonicum]
MIGYTCKYTPIEIFTSLGVEIKRIEPNVTSYDKAETMMHTNLCSYVKGVLEDAILNDYEGIILTSCCDSTRRLYDTLKENFPDKFIYILDLPRKVNEDSIKIYESVVTEMIRAYEEFSHKSFDEKKLKEVCDSIKSDNIKPSKGLNIGLMGARCNDGIVEMIEKYNANILFNISCTGDDRKYNLRNDNIYSDYIRDLLSKLPCLHMADISERNDFLKKQIKNLDGIIYHTVKFCDIYSYEYADIKGNYDIPVLKVETDYTKQCEGQIKTRVEAFVESLNANKEKGDNNMDNNDSLLNKAFEESSAVTKYVMGIDSGSTSTNAVILKNNREIVAYTIVRTGAKSSESAKRALEEVLEKARLTREDLSLIVSTGYGRVSITFADKEVTEISCHGKGAHYLNSNIRTIIDIGGQDSKVIKLNDKGEVIDFVMNDKCAAGTGRFLEMMARTLEIDIKDMGPESLKWKEDIKISSMCSVFAESEVISLIAQNKEKADIIHALNQSISSRTNALLGRVGKESGFMMTGGVAQNIGVVKAIEEKVGEKLFISDEPEIVGALGAAIFGLEDLKL